MVYFILNCVLDFIVLLLILIDRGFFFLIGFGLKMCVNEVIGIKCCLLEVNRLDFNFLGFVVLNFGGLWVNFFFELNLK